MIQIAIKATHNLDDCEDFCLRLLGDEPEALGIVQHRRVDRQPEMPGQDTGEKDECHAQRDAEAAYPAEGDPDRRNERNNHDGLQGRVFDE